MIITLRDDKKEFPQGSTAADIARSISDGLFRASLVAKVNGNGKIISSKWIISLVVFFYYYKKKKLKK